MKTDELYEEIEVPADLESRLETLIDNLAETERKSKRKFKQMSFWIGGIAASIVVLLAIGWLLNNKNKPDTPLVVQTAYSDEELEFACRETQKALELVARNFNKGLDQLALVEYEIEKTNQLLNKTLKR
jgi:hypothetical protein